jgi:hypothetical protein
MILGPVASVRDITSTPALFSSLGRGDVVAEGRVRLQCGIRVHVLAHALSAAYPGPITLMMFGAVHGVDGEQVHSRCCKNTFLKSECILDRRYGDPNSEALDMTWSGIPLVTTSWNLTWSLSRS